MHSCVDHFILTLHIYYYDEYLVKYPVKLNLHFRPLLEYCDQQCSCLELSDSLSVEVMECMACSDNVVRAGLTIKHRDKDTLCQMLTYNTKPPEENKFSPCPHPSIPEVEVYDPPTPEFTVARICIPQGTEEFLLPAVTGT